MVTSVKELHGAVGIYFNPVLGSGTYGRVCKAKCGLLPCLAKVFHDSLFLSEGSSNQEKIHKLEQECKHLTAIRHPNLVQYLGTAKDPNTQLPLLFMEALDEDLTQYLRNSARPLPYHLQMNIGYDVGLGLAYLHFNTLIHGALMSNNVLIIGEASRAKLSDFGLYKFVETENLASDSNGTIPYLAPEALSQPHTHSNQADCFSYGVVLLQILTRKFPIPTNTKKTDDDKKVKILEIERRKKDISLVDPSHELLPIILGCLKDTDTERLSADKICERIALLKKKALYQKSHDDHFTSLDGWQQKLQKKEKLLELCNLRIQKMKAEHEKELKRLREGEENDTKSTCKETKEDALIEEKTEDDEDVGVGATDSISQPNESSTPAQALILPSPLQDQDKTDALDETPDVEQIEEKSEQSLSQHESHERGGSSCDPGESLCEPDNSSCESSEDTSMEDHTPAEHEKWSQRSPAPETMGTLYGAAVVHGKTTYFSRHYNIYSYKLSQDKWSKLQPCSYQNFSLVVLDDHVTTIGGITRDLKRTRALFSLSKGEWKECYTPMPTHRVCAAALTTSTHLVVAGGRNKSELQSIEVMDRTTHQWFSAPNGLPESMGHPQMTLCNGHLFLCKYRSIFSTPMEDLLKPCLEESGKLNFTWKKLTDLPFHMGGVSLVSLEEKVVAIGGHDTNDKATGDICSYNEGSDSWIAVGEMPTPRGDALTGVLPGNILLIVGGWSELQFYAITDVARLNVSK